MARKPKQAPKSGAKKRPADKGGKGAKGGRAGGTAFALAVFLVVAAAAGTVAWLQLTYDPNTAFNIPVVETDVASPVEAAKPLKLTGPASPTDKPSDTAAHAPAGAHTPADGHAAGTDGHAAPADSRAAHGATTNGATTPITTPSGEPALQTSALQHSTAPPLAPPPVVELAPVPDPTLVKETPDGPLPIIAPDGRTALQTYARPHRETGRPRIAIVMGSLGLSRAATTAAIQQLPGAITLAFAPYGRDLQGYIGLARAAGHEVLLQIPMEPVDYPTNDPGPHTLLTTLPARKNLERLDWLLSRFTGYVGVMNYMGSRFTASDAHLRPVLIALRDRGLMFLDARSTSASVAFDVASGLGVPAVANDRYIDDEASRPGIDRRLEELQRLAVANGKAIGLAFPYPVTIERLSQWARQLHGIHGIDLVPISALVTTSQAQVQTQPVQPAVPAAPAHGDGGRAPAAKDDTKH